MQTSLLTRREEAEGAQESTREAAPQRTLATPNFLRESLTEHRPLTAFPVENMKSLVIWIGPLGAKRRLSRRAMAYLPTGNGVADFKSGIYEAPVVAEVARLWKTKQHAPNSGESGYKSPLRR